MVSARIFVAVGILALILIVLGELDARRRAPGGEVAISAGEECPPGAHDLNYFRVIHTIAIVYFLVTPALCLFAFRRQGEPMSAWFAFWLFAFLAYVLHLYWAIFGMMGGQFQHIYHCPKLVNHPWHDSALTLAWAIDVALCCAIVISTGNIWQAPRWFRLFHGFVSIWLFVALVGVWITKAGTWSILAP